MWLKTTPSAAAERGFVSGLLGPPGVVGVFAPPEAGVATEDEFVEIVGRAASHNSISRFWRKTGARLTFCFWRCGRGLCAVSSRRRRARRRLFFLHLRLPLLDKLLRKIRNSLARMLPQLAHRKSRFRIL